jgi:hypothetical protein
MSMMLAILSKQLESGVGRPNHTCPGAGDIILKIIILSNDNSIIII